MIWCSETKKSAVIDPGGDLDRILDAAKQNGATIEKVLITHGHIDHAGSAAELAEQLDVPIEGPQRDDSFWIDMLQEQGEKYGSQMPGRFS